jgi:hypothetical protein
VALDRQASYVRSRDQEQHDHERRAEAYGDQRAPGVLTGVVERLLSRRCATGLVGRELLGAARHLVEQAELWAQEDLLHARVVAALERGVRDVVQRHELVKARANLVQEARLARVGQILPSRCEIGSEVPHRVLEAGPRRAIVVTVGRLPAVEVRHVEFQVERERALVRALLHLVEALTEPAHPVEGDGDGDHRAEDRQQDRHVELRPDGHRVAPDVVWPPCCSS